MSKCPRCAIYLVESFQVKIIHVGHFVEIDSCSLHQWTLGDASFVQLDAIMTTPTFFLQRRHQLVRGTPRKTNGWNRENHLFGRENHLKQTFGSLGFSHQLAATLFHWNPHQKGDWCWIIMNDCKFWWFWPHSSPDFVSEIHHLWDSDHMMSLCVARFLVCFILDHCLPPVIWHHMAPILSYITFFLNFSTLSYRKYVPSGEDEFPFLI